MVGWALSFALGNTIFWYFGRDYSALVLIASLVAILLGIVFIVWQQYQCRKGQKTQDSGRHYLAVALAGVGLALGMLWAMANNHFNAPWQGFDVQQKIIHRLTGTVISLPVHHRHYSAVTMSLKTVDGNKEKGKVKVYWGAGGRKVSIGQTWQLSVKFKPATGVHNPAGIDREQQMFRDGIGTVATVQKKPAPKMIGSEGGLVLQQLRADLSKKIGIILSGSPMKGIIQDMTLADKRYINNDVYSVFQRTGTGHLLAISGLHIGMVAGLAWWLIGLAWSVMARSERWPRQPVQAVAAVSAGLIYAALAGFSVPTTRAAVMLVVAGYMLLKQNKSNIWQPWSIAMIVLCIVDPTAVLSPGFILSFGAVACLLLMVSAKRMPDAKLAQHLQVSSWLLLAMLPMTLGLFQQVSLVSYLSNIIAIPWVMVLVVPAALLGLVTVAWWPEMATIILDFAATSMQWLYLFLQKLAALPWAVWSHAIPNVIILSLATLGVLLWFLPRRFPGRAFAWVLLVPALLPWTTRVGQGELLMTIYDVGQGLAVLLQTKNHKLLFDTGPSRVAGGNAGASIIVPMLRHQGIAKLDRVIISHGDDDHVGGLAAINQQIIITDLLAGEPKKTKIATAQPCVDGQQWQWDGVDFMMIHPSKKGSSGNNQSCVLKVTTQDSSVLIPGDLEKKGEKRLVKKHNKMLPATILIAGHHGSKTSSSAAFVNKVRPQWVVYSTGAFNQYGFPHEQVTQRFKQLGTKAINTAESGQISILLSPNKQIEVKTERARNHHVWAWLY